ncbi:MAG: ACT domain-containing protein [Planctomycetes bacterium]|nr:ACT domain-containing protein [Planctomycetota bacterium]
MTRLKLVKGGFSVCKLRDLSRLDLSAGFSFLAKTPDEISLVCPSGEEPDNAAAVDAGWRAFRVEPIGGAPVGVLSSVSRILGQVGLRVFAISTFDTDYILVKEEVLARAGEVLTQGGITIV